MTHVTADTTGRLSTGLYLAVVILAWGGNYALVKLALDYMAPFTFNAARFGGAAVVVGGGLMLMGSRLLPLPGERLGLAVIGLCQVTIMLGLTSLGLLWIEASRAVLLAYTMPLWALLLGALLLGEAVTRSKLTGAAIGFLGLVMLFNPLAMDWSDRDKILGSGLAILGSIGWALGSTIYRMRRWQSGFWSQVLWQTFIGALPLLALALVLEHDAPVDPAPLLGALIVYNWFIPAAFAYWCWSRVLTRMTASSAGQALMLAPVYGVVLSIVLFAEPFRPMLLLSGALILLGTWLTLRPWTKPVDTSQVLRP